MKKKDSKEPASPRKRAQWRGENYERRVAKLIKGVVVGRSKAVKVQGDGYHKWIEVNPSKPPDVVNTWLSVECKYWSNLPVWLKKLMSQAIDNCPKGQTPAGWCGDRDAQENYVIMREKDFLDLLIGKNG